MKGTSWILNERMDLKKCEGWDANLTSKIICDEQGEPLEPIWKSEILFNGKKPGHYEQADFESGHAYVVSIDIRKPEFFSDIAEVMSKNRPTNVLINEISFSSSSNMIYKGIFNLSTKSLDENGFPFFCISANLREKGLERFIDPVQKACQKAWDFLLIDEKGRCGKTYPAFVK